MLSDRRHQFLPLPLCSSLFWHPDLQLCSPNCNFLGSWNVLHSHYLQVKGLQMSQDHITVLLITLLRWIDPVRSALEQGQVLCVAWEQAQGWVGSIAAFVGGDRRGYLPSTTGVGPVYCFTFSSWNWKCSCLRGLYVGYCTEWRTVFHF